MFHWQPHPSGVFHKIFGGGGLAFGDDFRSPSGAESDGGGLMSRTDRVRWGGNLEKLSAEAKNYPNSKIKLEQILVF